jgi:hypothetical protein
VELRTLKPDNLDLARLRDLTEDPAFGLVLARIREMAAAEQQQALTAATWDQTLVARGAREALLRVLQLPQILAKEIQGRARK